MFFTFLSKYIGENCLPYTLIYPQKKDNGNKMQKCKKNFSFSVIFLHFCILLIFTDFS